MKYTLFYIFFILLLSSCCVHYDNTVPKGYPYDNNTFEVKFEEYKISNSFIQSSFNTLKDSQIIKDTVTCESYFKAHDSTYENNIDFSKFDLIRIKDGVINASGTFQIRVLFNNKEKKVVVESRKNYNVCGYNTSMVLNKYYLIPKVPDGYTYSRVY